MKINSLHNQSIDRLGLGLEVSGRDLDGIVQAVEKPDHPFLAGVPIAPAVPRSAFARQRRLFRRLIDAAADYRETRRR
ncbi:MAG: gamma-glutamyl-gamma-aminobutyrate hydrolase family protein [Woeseiaceae bacterium]|nr:gamma-glutamyl-gamma-aminobutyrate hydrolase family protein [Woeseiaceae bacterium]